MTINFYKKAINRQDIYVFQVKKKPKSKKGFEIRQGLK